MFWFAGLCFGLQVYVLVCRFMFGGLDWLLAGGTAVVEEGLGYYRTKQTVREVLLLSIMLLGWDVTSLEGRCGISGCGGMWEY